MATQYKAYCFDHSGSYSKPVTLVSPEEVYDYCEENKNSYYELRILVIPDDIVVHVKEGLYVFPEEWKIFNQ